jgi:hypothetical protein
MAEISPVEHGVMWIGAYELQPLPGRALARGSTSASNWPRVRRHRWPQVREWRAERPGAAPAGRRSGSRQGQPQGARMKTANEDFAARRAHRALLRDGGRQGGLEARPPSGASGRVADDLPEHRRARLHRAAAGAGGCAGAPSAMAPPSTPRPPVWSRCANASAAGTRAASAWTCPRAASWSPPVPRRPCNWPAWP